MMKLAVLCRNAGVACPAEWDDVEITSVESDIERVKEGSLYVALRGFRRNGEKYISKAFENGAAAAVTVNIPEDLDPADTNKCLVVSDTRATLACLYDAWYGMPSDRLKLIGVTGTNGKTSVTCMLDSILSAAGYRVGRIGTLGAYSAGRSLDIASENRLANLTTPDPSELYRILSVMAEDGCDYVVMEVSSHSLALGKVTPLAFLTSIYTNLTPEHLDFHKTMQAYLAAKQKLFSQSSIAIVNVSDTYAEQILSVCDGKIITCGTETSDYRAENIDMRGAQGVSYSMVTPKGSLPVTCPVPGIFTVMNSMQAAACALELKVPESTVLEALKNFSGVPGRMESVLAEDACFSVIIDYAHTPDALENLLRTAREIRGNAAGRVTVLFGCGGDRDHTKRKEMGAIASRLADFVIVTSDNSRSEDPVEIIRQVLGGVDREKEHIAITNRREAIRYAVENAEAGDILLLAGKGHETYEIDRTGKHPFDERIEVRRAYQARMKKRNGQK